VAGRSPAGEQSITRTPTAGFTGTSAAPHCWSRRWGSIVGSGWLFGALNRRSWPALPPAAKVFGLGLGALAMLGMSLAGYLAAYSLCLPAARAGNSLGAPPATRSSLLSGRVETTRKALNNQTLC